MSSLAQPPHTASRTSRCSSLAAPFHPGAARHPHLPSPPPPFPFPNPSLCSPWRHCREDSRVAAPSAAMKFATAAAALLLVSVAAASAKRAALRSPLAQPLSSSGGSATLGQDYARREMVQVAPAAAAAWGEKRQVVVLSDIHIGDGSPTQNYQAHVHEGYLLGVLDDIVARNESIAEVVLAGDIFELWCYPFHTHPPSLAAILAANPNLFGPTGGFARVLDALGGRVTFIPGNHDMHLTADDVAQIRSPGGHYVKFAARSYSPGGDTCVVMAHGHEAAMFNAPDKSSKWAPLPMGHFVSRVVSSYWAAHLPPNTTVGDLPNLGNPSSSSTGSYLLPILLGIQAGNFSVAPQVLDAYARFYGANQSAEIIMRDGTTTTIAEAKQEYALLFQRWIQDNGGGAAGVQVALKALWVDMDSSYMGWFATKHALESGASLVVYGHTHVPVRGLVNPMLANYINTGFECAGAPDLQSGSKAFSFLTIDMPTLPGSLNNVLRSGSTYSIAADVGAGAQDVVEGGTQDYSSYAVIDNSASTLDLTLAGSTATQGRFVVLPTSIKAGTRAAVWVQDFPAPPI
ncbi:unnamed protein product [Closterium sp. Yama58-4]|nr:unnamed protein product [Closterium sp. Yama58-4]